MTLKERLISRLTPVLGDQAAMTVVAALMSDECTAKIPAALLSLYGELQDRSPKAARAAIEALPELQRRAVLTHVIEWLDLAVALAEQSGALALKYCSESPLILSLLPAASRQEMLQLALELADPDTGEPHAAVEFFRIAPELLPLLTADLRRMKHWTDTGAELARTDYVLGIEFFRQAPSIARVIQSDDVQPWINLGLKLITENSLGKRDYLGTLEFFRTSPTLLGEIEPASARSRVIALATAMADRSPATAIEYLAQAPHLLKRTPPSWAVTILQYGMLIAERDAEAAALYCRRCPEVLELIGAGSAEESNHHSELLAGYETWYRAGLEVLEYSREGGRAYFSLETSHALKAVEQAISGVPLRQVARTLKLFAQALCGADVAIQALAVSEALGTEAARAKVSPDGRTIALPAVLRRYPTREHNIRLYTVMTAHEAGHLEYGTYTVSLDRLADLVSVVHRRYGRLTDTSVASLMELFQGYPQPRLAQDLWTLLEDARVEYRLQQDYPGLSQDLKAFAAEGVRTRSLEHGFSIRELVVDNLLLLSTTEASKVSIPEAVRSLTEEVWTMCQAILRPTATAEDVVRLVDRVYVWLDGATGSSAHREPDRQSDPEPGAGPSASEVAGEYRPVTNWTYRGVMDPTAIGQRSETGPNGQLQTAQMAPTTAPPRNTLTQAGAAAYTDTGTKQQSAPYDNRSTDEQTYETITAGNHPSSVVEHLLFPPTETHTGQIEQGHDGERTYLYDEWDGTIRDYRHGWCRVHERRPMETHGALGTEIRARLAPSIRLLRRYFESWRPSEFRRRYGQTDGEEVDLDAAIQRRIDQRSGAEPSDALYLHREKRARSVAAAFLVDLSGSTGRHLDYLTHMETSERVVEAEHAVGHEPSPASRRIIDVEREGLLLLGEALEAIGDQYAVYGYSGQGRKSVELVVLKEFDEIQPGWLLERIGALAPLQQNRDGAAIRHVARKLLERDARNHLLVVLSDGRPLDDQYTGEYALEDTKMALQEARQQGIEPFCITVDRAADDYLRRMYGNVDFAVIDDAAALPQRLPRIYRRLTM